MKKKIIAGAVSLLTAVCVTATAFAGKLDSFMLGDYRVNCELDYHDSTGGNPFDNDSVTAVTQSEIKMELVFARATLYYREGTENVAVDDVANGYDSDYAEITVSRYTGATGYGGKGEHEAFDGVRIGSGKTSVTW